MEINLGLWGINPQKTKIIKADRFVKVTLLASISGVR